MHRVVFASLAALTACGSGDIARDCIERPGCLQAGIEGVCLPSPSSEHHWCAFPDPSCLSGQRWGVLAGDSLEKSCVESQALDAGLIDGGVIDAGAVDASPETSPVTTNQAAEIVLGQSDFVSGNANAGGIGPASLDAPFGLARNGQILAGWDQGNSRVLLWTSPSTTHQAANMVIGKTSFIDSADGPTATALGFQGNGGSGLAFGSGALAISDGSNNRVLLYILPVNSNGPAASTVVGQQSFTTRIAGDAATQMNQPSGVWIEGPRLIVADSGNNRVLIWSSLPTVSGAAANVVLGWPAFGMGDGDPPLSPPSAASLNYPHAVTVSGGRLFVADGGNHRVLVWNSIPTTNGAPADYVIGQPDLVTGSPPPLDQSDASSFRFPSALAIGANSLFVGEINRVTVFTPVPTATGATASAVLGQPDFTTDVAAASPSANNVFVTGGLVVLGDFLFVSDTSFNRILGFRLNQ